MKILQKVESYFKTNIRKSRTGRNFFLIALITFLSLTKNSYSQEFLPEKKSQNNELFVYFFPSSESGVRYVINAKQIDLLTRIEIEKEVANRKLKLQTAINDSLAKENKSLNKQLFLAEEELKGTDKIDNLTTAVISLKDENTEDYQKKIKNGKTWNTVLICGIPVSFGLGIALTAYIYSTTNGN